MILYTDQQNVLDKIEFDIKDSNCILFLGAGISTIFPSNLPNGSELKDFLLDCLFDTKNFKKYSNLIKNNDKYKYIVPEVLFQDIYEILNENIFKIYSILENSKSNHIHKTISYFSNYFGVKLFTTNFDSLIDVLLTDENAITHLHGSLLEKENLSILIKRIIRGIENKYKLEFEHALKGKNLYVLGYSGNDKDIMDLIRTSKPEKIFWMMRDIKDSWVLNNLLDIKKQNVLLFESELGVFFSQLQVRFNLKHCKTNYPSIHKKNREYRQKIKKDLLATLNDYKRYALLKLTFYRLQEYHFAYAICKEALSNLSINKHRKLWLWFVIHICDCLIITNEDIKEGHVLLDKALKSKFINTFKKEMGLLNNMKGLFYIDNVHPNPKYAIPYFEKAKNYYLVLLKMESKKENIDSLKDCLAKTYNNLGYAYYLLSNNDLALKYYADSLILKTDIGDMFGKTTTMVNIAITELKSGNNRKYYYWKRKADYFLNRYSQHYRIGYFKKEVGLLLINTCKVNAGIKKLKESLEIYEKYIPSANKEIQEIKSELLKFS